jgi:hypothetical protein
MRIFGCSLNTILRNRAKRERTKSRAQCGLAFEALEGRHLQAAVHIPPLGLSGPGLGHVQTTTVPPLGISMPTTTNGTTFHGHIMVTPTFTDSGMIPFQTTGATPNGVMATSAMNSGGFANSAFTSIGFTNTGAFMVGGTTIGGMRM